MIALPGLVRTAAAAMSCSWEPRAMSDYVRGCMCGSEWIGTWHIRQALCSCLHAVISVLESRSSFGCIAEGGTMNRKRFALLLLAGSQRASVAGADQTHRDARRRHDVKLLSIRCETAPTAPVWRCKCRCQLN